MLAHTEDVMEINNMKMSEIVLLYLIFPMAFYILAHILRVPLHIDRLTYLSGNLKLSIFIVNLFLIVTLKYRFFRHLISLALY